VHYTPKFLTQDIGREEEVKPS